MNWRLTQHSKHPNQYSHAQSYQTKHSKQRQQQHIKQDTPQSEICIDEPEKIDIPEDGNLTEQDDNITVLSTTKIEMRISKTI